MKQQDIREWEENNRLIDFKWALTRRKEPRAIKEKGRDTSYKLKSKLVVIRRNIQHFTGTALS